MIKIRPPDSIEDAITQACALLGTEAIAMALGARFGRSYSASLVQKWSDAENETHRIGLHHALEIERLLLKTEHEPIFGVLFALLRPAPPEAQAPDPIHAAIAATVGAAKLLENVRAAVQDGELHYTEVAALRAQLTALQSEMARLKRSLVVKPKAEARSASSKG